MEKDIVYHGKKYIKHTSQSDPSKIINQLLNSTDIGALKDKTQDQVNQVNNMLSSPDWIHIILIVAKKRAIGKFFYEKEFLQTLP